MRPRRVELTRCVCRLVHCLLIYTLRLRSDSPPGVLAGVFTDAFTDVFTRCVYRIVLRVTHLHIAFTVSFADRYACRAARHIYSSSERLIPTT